MITEDCRRYQSGLGKYRAHKDHSFKNIFFNSLHTCVTHLGTHSTNGLTFMKADHAVGALKESHFVVAKPVRRRDLQFSQVWSRLNLQVV
jgi:hypothetical protein